MSSSNADYADGEVDADDTECGDAGYYKWNPSNETMAMRWDLLMLVRDFGVPPDKAVATAGKFEKYITGVVRETQ